MPSQLPATWRNQLACQHRHSASLAVQHRQRFWGCRRSVAKSSVFVASVAALAEAYCQTCRGGSGEWHWLRFEAKALTRNDPSSGYKRLIQFDTLVFVSAHRGGRLHRCRRSLCRNDVGGPRIRRPRNAGNGKQCRATSAKPCHKKAPAMRTTANACSA